MGAFLLVKYFRSVGFPKAGFCGEDGGQSGGNELWFLLLLLLANLVIVSSESLFHPRHHSSLSLAITSIGAE